PPPSPPSPLPLPRLHSFPTRRSSDLPGARIGSRTTLHAGARVLDCARVGEDCVLWPGAVVREHCILGDRVILQPNAVVGSDGFGDRKSTRLNSSHVKISYAVFCLKKK